MKVCLCQDERAGESAQIASVCLQVPSLALTRVAFLHILPSSGWHSSLVIGYLKGRSCFVRNDFLSPFLNYAACLFVRCLTEEHKSFMHF